MSVINILMQLRKVCNHPNLFDPRPTVSPFIDEGVACAFPALVVKSFEYNPFEMVDLAEYNLLFSHLHQLSYAVEESIVRRLDGKQMEQLSKVQQPVYVRLNDSRHFMQAIYRSRQNSRFLVINPKLKMDLILKPPLSEIPPGNCLVDFVHFLLI